MKAQEAMSKVEAANAKAKTPEWWQTFSVLEMADLFLERTPEELTATTEFLTDKLKLGKQSLVFDQCCGAGAISHELARSGNRVIGVDLFEPFIRRAVTTASKEDLSCKFVCDDAFAFVTDEKCDGAFNWYSSFGYAKTDEQNQQMLGRAFESLKPGGFYSMDVPNFAFVLSDFKKQMVRKGVSAGKEVTCTRDCRVDLVAGVLNQTWTWESEGLPGRIRKSELKIYFPQQIAKMLSAVGFVDVRMFGGVDRSDLEIESHRLVVVARRPE